MDVCPEPLRDDLDSEELRTDRIEVGERIERGPNPAEKVPASRVSSAVEFNTGPSSVHS